MSNLRYCDLLSFSSIVIWKTKNIRLVHQHSTGYWSNISGTSSNQSDLNPQAIHCRTAKTPDTTQHFPKPINDPKLWVSVAILEPLNHDSLRLMITVVTVDGKGGGFSEFDPPYSATIGYTGYWYDSAWRSFSMIVRFMSL